MNNSVFIGRKVSKATSTWLLQNNICFEEHQLIQIVLNKPDLREFETIKNRPKQFVITSQWAALWLVKYYRQIGLRKQDIIFCLSEKQKIILKHIVEDISVSEHPNVMSLADLVIKRNNSGVVVFLRGNQSLNIKELGRTAFCSGFKSIEVYQNLPVIKKVRNEFSRYIFFSPSGVRNFYNSGSKIPKTAEIIAIGETTAETCSRLYQNRVLISKKQDEFSVVHFAIEQNKQLVTV